MLTLVFFLFFSFFASVSLHLLYCETGPDNVEPASIWKQQVKGANKSKPAARAVHLQAQFNADALYFITLVFTRRIRIPDLLQHLFNLSHPDFFFILILVRRHRVVSVRVPLHTFLCMNDCTLPIHLNSILHITSTLIWATKCVFCMYMCLGFSWFLLLLFFFSFLSLFTSQLSFHEFHWCCCNSWMDPVAEMTFSRSWPAFYNDCKRWKCFTAHFRTFVVINKTALN